MTDDRYGCTVGRDTACYGSVRLLPAAILLMGISYK